MEGGYKEAVKVLGIDASLRGTGLAVIELQGSRAAARHWEVVEMPAQAPHSASTRICRFFLVLSVRTSPSSSANLEACSASSKA